MESGEVGGDPVGSLEFGHAGHRRQLLDGVPELDGFRARRRLRDHRTEEAAPRLSAPGWNVRIGVPTSRPARLSASSVSAADVRVVRLVVGGIEVATRRIRLRPAARAYQPSPSASSCVALLLDVQRRRRPRCTSGRPPRRRRTRAGSHRRSADPAGRGSGRPGTAGVYHSLVLCSLSIHSEMNRQSTS